MNTLLYFLVAFNMNVTTPANHKAVILKKAGAECLVLDLKLKEYHTYNRVNLR